ncbi:aquaporin [Limnobacter humi]|uniref:Aquaporin n=1 Tax=Limnobacter humi TaxID=1778671 RepID=A0ABT1WF11_9BURK|nr:aquaporin [Limnobacter humi]MCQ8895014.1 aquaporin [Limnobacter humi]
MQHTLPVRLVSECLGTLLLLCTVIGSGIMGVNLSQGNDAIALLANTLATVFGLFVLIELFGSVGGAHFNPVVTGVQVLLRRQPARELLPYMAAQLLGAWLGAVLANAMFDWPLFHTAQHVRTGAGVWLGEVVATAGLLLVIVLGQADRMSALVAAYIGAAYWFTSSTSFANPAAVFGRMFSDSFAGIAPGSAPAFVVAEALGGLLAVAVAVVFNRRLTA